MHTKTFAVDAIPEPLMHSFLKAARNIHPFWFDMFLLSATFGLRNIECRELKVEQIDLANKIINLDDTKTDRANVTKRVNRQLEKQWLLQGRHWLKRHIKDENASLIVRLASSTKELELLAEEYQLKERYQKAKKRYYNKEESTLRAQIKLKNTPSRLIDFSSFRNIEVMLSQRVERYKDRQFIFPSDELKTPLFSGKVGVDRPISRQSVYNVLQKLRSELQDGLKGIRVGLHSFRKFAVQKVADLMKDTFAASVWIGHGNGKGNLAMTERYLNRSEQRYEEINSKLSEACRFSYNSKLILNEPLFISI